MSAEETLQQFAYAVSHDLREPARKIGMFGNILKEEADLPKDLQPFLDKMMGASDRLLQMMDAILTWSRVESQGAPLAPTDLNEVVAQALSMKQKTLGAADVTVEELPEVQADRKQIRWVVDELLTNAIKFQNGPLQIRISWDEGLVFTSTGTEIPADRVEKALEMFQVLQKRSDHAGCGAGLAICTRIMERHGALTITPKGNLTEIELKFHKA